MEAVRPRSSWTLRAMKAGGEAIGEQAMPGMVGTTRLSDDCAALVRQLRRGGRPPHGFRVPGPLSHRERPYIYWANWGAGRGTTIGRANLDGTAVNPSFISGASTPCDVAINASYIYWGNSGTRSMGAPTSMARR